MSYLREVMFGTEFLSWLFFFFFFCFLLRLHFPVPEFVDSSKFFLQFSKMLAVQGQAEIIQKVCGALDKYESKLSAINQKVCMLLATTRRLY